MKVDNGERGTCGGKEPCTFVMQHQDGSLCCTLKPPTMVIIPVVQAPTVKDPNGSQGMTVQGFFPPVLPAWSCGEWQPRDARQPSLNLGGKLAKT